MNLQMSIYSKNYSSSGFLSLYKEFIGQYPDFTTERYEKISLDYNRTMLAERTVVPTLTVSKIPNARPQIIGVHRNQGPPPQPKGIRPFQVFRKTEDGRNALKVMGLMTCPTGVFTLVDLEGLLALDRFVDMGNQGKKMDVLKVYWHQDKYTYNWARTLLRSQRKGRATPSQVAEHLNRAIKTRATNLYGWINGAFADFRQEDLSGGYLDDPDSHPSAIDF